MQSEIKGGSAFSYIKVSLAPGESLTTRLNAMSSMAFGLKQTFIFNGGFLSAIIKRVFSNDSILLNRYTNTSETSANMTIAQMTPGEIRVTELNGSRLNIQPSALIACSSQVKLGFCWAGFSSFFNQGTLFRLKASGYGFVWYGAYGGLMEKDIDGEHIINSDSLIAYEPSLSLKTSSLLASDFDPKNSIIHIKGAGRVTIQSRNTSSLAHWLHTNT